MPDYTLYSYYRSSCSGRLRVTLNYKGIPYELKPVNLVGGEQLTEAYKAENPSASVPTLVCHNAEGAAFNIGQSIAALEYLEEIHPQNATLPALPDVKSRATIRALVNIVSADIQPPTNMKIMKRIKELGGSAEAWNKRIMGEGLRAYEAIALKTAGKYSYGDQFTMADACLIPAVWNAQRYEVDLNEFPTVMRIFDALSELPAVKKAHWKNQPDCPEELRK